VLTSRFHGWKEVDSFIKVMLVEGVVLELRGEVVPCFIFGRECFLAPDEVSSDDGYAIQR
jgi:hypothetical protein